MVVAESARTLAITLPNEAATAALAEHLAPALFGGGVVYLRGELGTGKTTFARALLRAMGVGERVKSPTYSLLERYSVNGHDAFHLDCTGSSARGNWNGWGLTNWMRRKRSCWSNGPSAVAARCRSPIWKSPWTTRGRDAVPI